MELHNIKAVYSLANTLYNTAVNPNDFEDIVLNGCELIGNKHTELVKEIVHPINRKVSIPCEATMIESVHLPYVDYQSSSNTSNFPQTSNAYTEKYAELSKWNTDPLYTEGRLVKYRLEDGIMHFDSDYPSLLLVYHKLITDDAGMPKVNDKELRALATYVAYVDTFKKSLVRQDGNIMQLAAVLEQKWLKLCSSARIPNKLSQNDMDNVLDSITRWDRKVYRKSYKPSN